MPGRPNVRMLAAAVGGLRLPCVFAVAVLLPTTAAAVPAPGLGSGAAMVAGDSMSTDESVVVRETVPGAPTNLFAQARDTTTIEFAWDAPADTGSSAVTGYRIEVSEDGGTTWANLDDDTESTETSYTHTGLEPGSTRHYRVSAINASGPGMPSDEASATTPTPPGAPTSLTAEAKGGRAIELNWEPPADTGSGALTGYEVLLWDGNDFGGLAFTGPAKTTFRHTGLQQGTTYQYQVRAYNTVAVGPPSNSASATTETPPGKPANLAAEAQDTTTIELFWDAPADTGSGAITGYRIQESADGSWPWTILVRDSESTQTSYEHTGLQPGTTRYYRVRAINVGGTGQWSDVASATTESPPGAPTNLAAEAQDTTTIELRWDAPADTGSSVLTGYRIEVSEDAGGTWAALVEDTESTQTSYEHTGLPAGATRHYRVAAISAVGTGPPSGEVSATTRAPPGAPTKLVAQAQNSTTIGLEWDVPADTGSSAITGYRIEVSEDGGGTWTALVEDTESTQTTYEHTGLQLGETRHYRVSAINADGTGPPSNEASTTAGERPGVPTDLVAEARDTMTIELGWEAPADTGTSAVTGYRIEVSEDAGGTWAALVDDTESTQTTYEHTGLEPASTRHYRVSAINASGTGPPSTEASATTESRPGAPTDLEAEAQDTTTIELRWDAPADTGSSAITGYRIEVSEDEGGTWADLLEDTESTQTTYEHTGLPAGATRHYRVAAITAVGTGPPSNEASATTRAPPGAPTNLIAQGQGARTIGLEWDAPADTGSSAITGYRIEVSANGGETWTALVEDSKSTQTSYEHKGLRRRATRHYRVSAINAAATGPPSNEVSTTAGRRPGAPADLVAEARGKSTIQLEWEAPADTGTSAVTGYRIEVSEDAGGTWADLDGDTESTRTTYEHTGLQPGSTRHYRVSAINASGTGPASDAASATTEVPPGAPTDLTAETASVFAIRLSWTAPADSGSSAITGYRIEISDDGGTNWVTLVRNTRSLVTTYEDPGLQPGQLRHYRVSAMNSSGRGPPSNVASARAHDLGVPGPPTSLTAEPVNPFEIYLSWTEPADTGMSAVTGYRIEVSLDEDGDWTELVGNTNSDGTDHTAAGLEPGSLRFYRVTAINDSGPGLPSPVASATTTGGRVPGVPTSLTAAAEGQRAIGLAWTAPADAGTSMIRGYRIEVSADGGTDWSDLETNTGSPETEYRHTGLQPGTVLHYRVSAINGTGTGSPSDVAVGTTGDSRAPGAPRNLTATAVGQSVIELEWSAPTDVGDSTVTGYRIEVSASGTDWTDLRRNTNTATTTFRQRGLPPGSRRYYRVSAISAVGTGVASDVASARTDATVPGAPTALRATPRGQTQIDLAWTAPSDDGGAAIAGYRIEVSEDPDADWTVLAASTGSTSTTYSHTGLSNGSTRHYRVSAVNAAGVGPASNVAHATTEAASSDPPTDLRATAISASRIDLSWKAPANDGGTAVTGYRIRVSTAGNHAWSALVEDTESTSTTYSHTTAVPGTTWHYRVAAINAAGPGPESNTAAATTPAGAPDAPEELAARTRGTSWIEVSWKPPAFDGGARVTGYRIETRQDDNALWTVLLADTRSGALQYQHVGLAPGTTMRYRVSAINSAGAGVPSSVARATTDATIPDAPTDFAAAASGSTGIDLVWRAPRYDGGAPISGHRIEVSENGVDRWRVLEANTGSATTSYAHTGLQPVSTRYYRVSAINSAGVGASSEVADATTDPAVPGEPGNLTATASGTEQIDLAWTPPPFDGGAPVTGYRIDVSADGAETWTQLLADTRSTMTAFSHVGLTPGTTRHYRVAAINSAGAGRPSKVTFAATDATVPDPPVGLRAVAVDHSQIDLAWAAPDFDGGSAITGYRIEYSEDGGASWTDLVANTESTATGYSHTGLRPATSCQYRVSAINVIGVGGPSGSATATTDAILPARPTNLAATPKAPTRIDLSWSAPGYDGGAPVIGYKVEVSEDGGIWSDLQTSTGSALTSYSHSGLTPGSTRYYRVSAINSVGAGPPSDVANASTDDPVERATRVNEAVLPHFAAAMTTSTLSAISHRIEAVATGSRGSSQPGRPALPSLAGRAIRRVERSGGSLGRLLDGSSFKLSLDRGGADGRAGTALSAAAWGGAEYVSMGEPGGDAVQWQGDMLSFHAGADVRLRRDLLVGVAGTRSSGEYDFTDVTGEGRIEGIYEADMTSLSPFVAWFPGRTGGAVWAVGSLGWGGVVVDDGIGGRRPGDTQARTGSLGGSYILLSSGASSLRLRGEAWLSQVEVGADEGMDSLTLEMKRARLAMEWSREHTLGAGHELGLLLNGATRYDDGDGTDGIGVELGAGLRFVALSKRLTIEGQGRMLATGGKGYEEWGVGGLIRIDPQGRNEGLSLSLAPAWGETAGRVEQLWEHGVGGQADGMPTGRGGRLNAEMQYRLTEFHGTPYTRFQMATGGSRALATGMRYQVSRVLAVHLEGKSAASSDGPPQRRLTVRGHWRW
ncbi:MAG: fibronectin type III domain-containing protein [Gemmatimonadetes bacterium]|nr:fibronectin type III domain-containing protein [Gemmatimonadota bacterium]